VRLLKLCGQIITPHPALSKGEGFKRGKTKKVLSFGEDLGEAAKVSCQIINLAPKTKTKGIFTKCQI
jgi:hypothetical protein